MKSWRPNRRQNVSPQPSLPGLFSSPDKTIRRLATPGEHALEIARARLVFTAIMFGIIYLVIAGRVVDLTLLNEPTEAPVAEGTASETSITARADITDRNGTVLATSLPTVSVCADAKKLFAPDEAVQKLLTALPDLDAAKLSADLHSSKRCVMLKRHLTPKQSYAVNKLGIAGLEFKPDERRIYPAGNVTAHVLGYTDIDNIGLAGLEKSLDDKLQQQPEPVALSLDLRLQTIMHTELASAIDEFHALAATGLIMDVTNGELLSLVSLPDYDPHRPGTASDDAKFNRGTLGVYEMGSTFKIFNTAMALDSGLIKVSDQFDATHALEVGHQTIRDFHPENRWLNVAEVFTHSSNIGSARMVEKLGSGRQRTFLSRLGLTSKLPFELPEVGAPLVPSNAGWGEAAMMTISFGHGIAVNAVQMAAAVASIVNDGQRVHATLIKGGNDHQPKEQIVSQRTSGIMRALMRLVVTHGTAKMADVPGYLVGGKTGTADKLNGKRYSENARLSSFIGVFPLNAPRYLVMVILDDPKGTAKTYGFATGGWTAAPVVGHVIAQTGPLLGVQPQDQELASTNEQQLLHRLGNLVLDRLQIDNEAEDYAANESNDAQ